MIIFQMPIRKLNQPYTNAKEFTEKLLEKVQGENLKSFKRPNLIFNGCTDKEPDEVTVARLYRNILSINDFNPVAYDEPVDTIFFQGIEYNRPVSLGMLPLPDENFCVLSETQKRKKELAKLTTDLKKLKGQYSVLTIKISNEFSRSKKLLRKKISDETRKRMSEARKGKSAWNKGMPRTEEEKKNIGEARKGQKRSQEAIQKTIESNTGKKRSEEFRKKMSEIAKGRKHTAETKAKLSKIAYQLKSEGKFTTKGIPLSDEHNRKLQEARAKSRQEKSSE